MDTALAEALTPVLRDLENTGSVIPEVRDDQWGGIEGQATGGCAARTAPGRAFP